MIRLPAFTFLSGPPGSGKSTLASALAELTPSLCRCSIAEPIRMALLSTWYPDQMTLGIDLRDQTVKKSFIPGTGITHRKWMISFSEWMKSLHGKQIFGDIAKRNVELQTQYYDRFVFDDCCFLDELRPFVNAYEGKNCIIVSLNRRGADWGDDLHDDIHSLIGLHHAAVNNNGTINEALSALASALGQTFTTEPATEDL